MWEGRVGRLYRLPEVLWVTIGVVGWEGLLSDAALILTAGEEERGMGAGC